MSPWARWAETAGVPTQIVWALSGFPGGMWQRQVLPLASAGMTPKMKIAIQHREREQTANARVLIGRASKVWVCKSRHYYTPSGPGKIRKNP
jgi:hypothetical protein